MNITVSRKLLANWNVSVDKSQIHLHKAAILENQQFPDKAAYASNKKIHFAFQKASRYISLPLTLCALSDTPFGSLH